MYPNIRTHSKKIPLVIQFCWYSIMETIDIPIADMRYFDINVLKGYFSFIASHLLYLHFPKQINASFGDMLELCVEAF